MLDIVRSYYDALNGGEPGRITEFLHPDAVHYYTKLAPHEGAEAIAEAAVLAREVLDASYWIEAAAESDGNVAIEWTMTWHDPGSGKPRIARGAEFYSFEDGRIAEVRSYNHSDAKNRSGELIGFDHAGRGYMTPEWRQRISEAGGRRGKRKGRS